MKNIFVLAGFCICGILVGCHQAEEMESVDENLKMSVVASIEGSDNSVTSRYGGDNPNAVYFKNGDAIGMAVNDGGFVQWTKDGTGDGWSPVGNSVYWSDKISDHSFIAFYPYNSNATAEGIPMPDLSGQNGTMASVALRDFLVAQKTQAYGTNGVVEFNRLNESVDYSFKHVSSLVIVTLKGEGELSSAQIKNISISGDNIITPSSCEIGSGGLTVRINQSKRNDVLGLELSHQMGSADKTFYFVVNSGTVSLSAVTLSISYTTSKGSYVATLNGLGTSAVTSFERGKKYSYSLKIAGGELIISGNAIQSWGEGLDLGNIVINGIEQTVPNEENNGI